jgi:membrane protease YdiL (CAAX protease family)
VTPRDLVILFGAGGPLIAAAVWVANRRGLFARDRFPSPARKRIALVLLVVVLTATVLLPAVSGSERIDPTRLSFASVFVGQGLLAAFLASWWALSGRPPLRRFLALESANPLGEAGAGFCLGLIGWALTLFVALLAGALAALVSYRVPQGIPPLVRWLAALPGWQRLLIVLSAMTIEEFHFRAFLQRRIGPVAASILFLLAHGGYGEPMFLVGLVAITALLATAFARTGSTVAPILAHGTFDAVQLFIFLPLALKLLSGR